MSNITNIGAKYHCEGSAGNNTESITDDYVGIEDSPELRIKAKFDKIIEAIKRGGVYTGKSESVDYKVQ